MSAITNLPDRVQALIDERQRHTDAISGIDKILAGIAASLGIATPRKPERPPGIPSATTAAKPKRRRTRRNYGTTGDESVLAFIKQNRNATTSEVKAHWASEDRRGTADNVLSKLFREGKVKRKALGKGIRGSRWRCLS